MNTCLKWLAAATAVAGTWSAVAQSASTPASAPARIAVSASDAAVAQKKAVPKAEVGTVVRTGPTATGKAKAVTSDKETTAPRPKKAHPAAGGASRPAKAD